MIMMMNKAIYFEVADIAIVVFVVFVVVMARNPKAQTRYRDTQTLNPNERSQIPNPKPQSCPTNLKP